MRSKLFKDTQGLECPPCSPERVSVCVRVSREAYAWALIEAHRLGLTSGEYLDQLILGDVRGRNRPQ